LGDHQAPAQGFERANGISIAEDVAVRPKRVREHIGVVGGFGGVEQPVRGGPRLLTGLGDRQRDDQGCPRECMGVAAACELVATPLDASFGLAALVVVVARGPSPWVAGRLPSTLGTLYKNPCAVGCGNRLRRRARVGEGSSTTTGTA